MVGEIRRITMPAWHAWAPALGTSHPRMTVWALEGSGRVLTWFNIFGWEERGMTSSFTSIAGGFSRIAVWASATAVQAVDSIDNTHTRLQGREKRLHTSADSEVAESC